MGNEIYNLRAIKLTRRRKAAKVRRALRKAVKAGKRPPYVPHQAAQLFYATQEWVDLRYKALSTRGARCECCGATTSDGVRMHVDHIKPRSKFPSLELDLNNLQILCEPCNIGKGNRDHTDWRSSGPLPSPQMDKRLTLVKAESLKTGS